MAEEGSVLQVSEAEGSARDSNRSHAAAPFTPKKLKTCYIFNLWVLIMVSSCCRRHDTSQNEVQVEREYKKDYETSTTPLHEQQIIKSMYKVRTRGTIMRELSLESSPRVKMERESVCLKCTDQGFLFP